MEKFIVEIFNNLIFAVQLPISGITSEVVGTLSETIITKNIT